MSRADRERQMLDVAEEIFAAHGYRGTSMDEIAERCGVSKPMLYEYFGSKDGLLLACVARCKAELYETTRAAIARATTPEDMVWRGMLAYFEFMDAHTRSFATLLQEAMAVPAATTEALESARRQQSDLIGPILGALFSPAHHPPSTDASFSPAHHPPSTDASLPNAPPRSVEAFTEIIIGGCERLALWRLRHPEVPAEEAARYMTDFTWNGLRAHIA